MFFGTTFFLAGVAGFLPMQTGIGDSGSWSEEEVVCVSILGGSGLFVVFARIATSKSSLKDDETSGG
jgi:hypothetical protein